MGGKPTCGPETPARRPLQATCGPETHVATRRPLERSARQAPTRPNCSGTVQPDGMRLVASPEMTPERVQNRLDTGPRGGRLEQSQER